MLFSDSVLYVHLPKAGGSTIKNCIQNSLPNKYYRVANFIEGKELGDELTILEATRTESKDESIYISTFLNGDKHLPIDFSLVFIDSISHKTNITSDLIKTIYISIRNPYDLLVSMWNFNKKWSNISEDLEFKDWLKLDIPYFSHYNPELYLESNNSEIQNKVKLIRFENMDEDLKHYKLLNLGLPEIEFNAPKLNVFEHDPFKSFYINDEESESIVYNLFRSFFENGFYKRYEGL